MGTTYLKRQKEMKRLEKQREKAERRAQKKIASRAQNSPPLEDQESTDHQAPSDNVTAPSESEPRN